MKYENANLIGFLWNSDRGFWQLGNFKRTEGFGFNTSDAYLLHFFKLIFSGKTNQGMCRMSIKVAT